MDFEGPTLDTFSYVFAIPITENGLKQLLIKSARCAEVPRPDSTLSQAIFA